MPRILDYWPALLSIFRGNSGVFNGRSPGFASSENIPSHYLKVTVDLIFPSALQWRDRVGLSPTSLFSPFQHQQAPSNIHSITTMVPQPFW